jgi:parallel beta-helix repeat protein
MKRVFSIMLSILLLASALAFSFKTQDVKASGAICIRADGSIDPPTAPISTLDNVTYTLTGNITCNGDGIAVQRDNIVVDGNGYTLQGNSSAIGITIEGRENVTIANMTITQFAYGVYLNSSSNNMLSQNNITNKYYGIYLVSSSNVTISRNNITNNGIGNAFPLGDGVVVGSSSNVTVSGNNIVANNVDGVFLGSSSSYNTVSGNNITANNYFGVCLGSSSFCNVVSENNITNNGGGVVLYSSSNNTISGNNVTANNWEGVWLESSYNTVSGNNIKANNRYGVYLDYYSSYNIVSGNNITANNGYAVCLDCSSNAIISGNNITNNDYGVYLDYSSSYNTVSGNNITANDVNGVVLVSYSSYNTVSGNSITDNEYGMYLESSSGNTLSGNNITANSWAGIWLESSSSNSVHHNNFNNTIQIHSEDSVNVWNNGYPSGGNYWNDYNGTDICSGPYQNVTGLDGIGDTPYTIDANNVDNYPLMTPYETKPPEIQVLSPQNQTYDGRLIPLNFTVYDYSPISWMGYSLDGQANATVTGNITLNVDKGSHTVVVYANGTYGNMGSSGAVYFSSLGGCVVIRVQYLDGAPRSGADVFKISPQPTVDLGTTNESGLTTMCGVLGPGDYIVQAAYSGQFGPNTDLIVNSNGDGQTVIQKNVEITRPAIVILSPQNLTYYNSSVPLNFTVYDYSPVSWMGYSLDSEANVTVSGNTTMGLSDGPHQVAVYANDTFGNMGSSTTTSFTVDTTIHDLAVTNVTITNNAVMQGEPVTINVTVENLGDNGETFNVTVYANATAVATIRNLTLSGHTPTTVSCIWDTVYSASGAYTVSAYASPVPSETSTTDNTFTDGTVQVTPNYPAPSGGGRPSYVC